MPSCSTGTVNDMMMKYTNTDINFDFKEWHSGTNKQFLLCVGQSEGTCGIVDGVGKGLKVKGALHVNSPDKQQHTELTTSNFVYKNNLHNTTCYGVC